MSKKVSKVYVYGFLVALFSAASEILELIPNFPYRIFISSGLVVVSVISIGFEFVSTRIPAVEEFKKRMMRRLGIKEVAEGQSSGHVNVQYKEAIKSTLLRQVDERCLQIRKNIEQSTIVIEQGEAIQTEQIHYNDFNGFIDKIRGTSAEHGHVRYAITGQPGSGKTFELINRLKENVDRVTAEREQGKRESQIPLYLSLNSWNYHTSFREWVEERIPIEYKGCSSDNIKTLMSSAEIIFFVDGLDEIAAGERVACFTALLEYSQGQSLIFSCRRDPLLALLDGIDRTAANYIGVLEMSPLTSPVIEAVIGRQDNAAELFGFLNSKRVFFEFLNTPLLLNLFLRVFGTLDDKTKQSFKDMQSDQVALFLWQKYDEVVLKDKYANVPHKANWSLEKVRTYMVWLARRMNGYTFFLDELQPAWLETKARIWSYYLTSRIISGIILAISVGLFVAGPFDFIGCGIMASLFVVFMTMKLDAIRPEGHYPRAAMILLFIAMLVLITSVYQGFAVPRLPKDMDIFRKVFSITESFAGILLGLFFGIIFGYRKSNQNASVDVHPLEQHKKRFRFNLKSALKTGVYGGVGMGIFLSLAAVAIRAGFHGTTFNRWLRDNMDRFMDFMHVLFPGRASLVAYFQLALFGFLGGFFIGFAVFSLIGGRKMASPEDVAAVEPDAADLDARLNQGIRKSLWYAAFYGVVVWITMTILYGSMIYLITGEKESIWRAVSIGAGTGIFSLLWFGGFEVIQHWVLRFYLYVYGMMPLRYARWVKIVQDSALLRQVGPSLQFYHPNLKNYYRSIPVDGDKRIVDQSRRNVLRVFMTVSIPLVLSLLLSPFVIRYFDLYWQRAHEISIVNKSADVISGSDTAWVVKKDGMLNLAVSGAVKVGTFTGTIGPNGTETGFLAFPLSDVYDIEPACRHGALIYQIVSGGIRSEWSYVISTSSYPPLVCIPVRAMDSIYFKVNDYEWQNNRGQFSIQMAFDKTCPILHNQ